MRPVLALLVLTLALRAEVTLPRLFSDHMVLQRNLPIHVWGKASAGETVTVKFQNTTRTTTADEIGAFSVYLPPVGAGGPYELQVNTVTLRDVLVGDVWVASGQSNMEWTLNKVDNAEAEIAGANHGKIRLFQVVKKVSALPIADVEARGWDVCAPEKAATFSAVAYFFARDIRTQHDVPIGLIDSTWGGTPVEAWTSVRGLSSSPQFMPVYSLWADMTMDYVARLERREKRQQAWMQAVEKARAAGTPPPPAPPWEPNQRDSWMPSGLYNGMIGPLTPYPIAGAIWYQGESNAGPERVGLYGPLFQAMIKDWRKAWGVGDFPFLFVQLANFKNNNPWPELRQAQTDTLGLANTGMAVTIDIGNPDDIHPRNKQDVGKRLARHARAMVYGEKIETSGPVVSTAVPEQGKLRVYFGHAKSLSAKGGALKGFEIAGADRKYVAAQGTIDGTSVVLTSPDVASPLYVRYAWANNPEATLYNEAGLPGVPFRWER